MKKPKIRLKEGGGILKKIGVYAIAAVLIAGIVLGAGIWLSEVDVPISYDEPYSIQMSESETDDYDFETIGFKETTEWAEADFEENDEGTQDRHYHQHVKIDNPADTGDVAVDVEIEEPTGWTDQMGFNVFDGIEEEDELVEPGDEDIEVEYWGSGSHSEAVPEGETKYFTVVYTLSMDAPEPNGYEVNWNFYEGESVNVPDDYDTIGDAIDGVDEYTTIFVESNENPYEEHVEVNKAGITLYGVREPTIEGRVSITEDRVTLDGFDVSPPDATDGAEAEAVIIQDSADYVTIKNNLVRDFSEDGIDQWEGIDGIVAFGGVDDDPVRNPVIIDNEVENLEGRDTKGGVTGISIQGNVDGATVEGNEVHDIGEEETAWAFGIVVRGTDNHDKVPTDVEISDNEVNTILSDPDTDTVGVGIGLESGDAGDVEFEDNDISTTEFLLEDKTATMDLKAFADLNTLDRGALLEEAPFEDTDHPNRNVIFDSIQNAIDEASPGTTIFVEPGTYDESESVVIGTDGLTLIGPNAGIHGDSEDRGDEATVTGGFGWDATDDITVDGFEVEREVGDGNGVFLLGGSTAEIGDNAAIENNVINAIPDPDDTGYQQGVVYEAEQSDELRIEGNLIKQEDPDVESVMAVNEFGTADEPGIGEGFEFLDNVIETDRGPQLGSADTIGTVEGNEFKTGNLDLVVFANGDLTIENNEFFGTGEGDSRYVQVAEDNDDVDIDDVEVNNEFDPEVVRDDIDGWERLVEDEFED